MNGKQILITTESHEILVIRQTGAHTLPSYCPDCKEDVEMLNFDSAISLFGIGGRDLMHRSESGDVHSIEAATGHLLICKRSLTRGLND